MALISRITRLFQADFHAVLDQVEEPRVLLRQALREMEDELAAQEQGLRGWLIEQEDLAVRGQDLGRTLAEIDGELDLCFEAGREELARELLRRKLQSQRLAQQLETRAGAVTKAVSAAQQRLLEHRASLESMRQKVDLLNVRQPGATAAPAGMEEAACTSRALSVSDSDVEVAFLREKKRRAAP